jgi:hypothetical protein
MRINRIGSTHRPRADPVLTGALHTTSGHRERRYQRVETRSRRFSPERSNDRLPDLVACTQGDAALARYPWLSVTDPVILMGGRSAT